MRLQPPFQAFRNSSGNLAMFAATRRAFVAGEQLAQSIDQNARIAASGRT
jgi:hypothetical protein